MFVTKIIRTVYVMLSLGLLLGLVACGSATPAAPPAEPTKAAEAAKPAAEAGQADGQELIKKMEAAVKALDKAHFTVAFQMATKAGGIKGSVQVWANRANKNVRIEFTSETEDIKGSIIGSNDTQGWVYAPKQNVFYTSAKYFMANPHLADQPEMQEINSTLREIWNKGSLGPVETTVTGSENVNGRDTYMVKTVSKETSEDSLLTEETGTIWIDKETFLPQQIELELVQQTATGTVSGKGLAILQGAIEQTEIEASMFTFTPPAGTDVVDVDAIPTPPPGNEQPASQKK